jgi:hypothetical protein
MPFTFTPADAELDRSLIYESFSHTFSATHDVETVTSVTVTASLEDDSVTLTNGATEASASGEYTIALFPGGIAKYVDKGESDKTQEPVVVSDFTLIPDGKELFQVIPDSNEEVTVTYTVTATTDLGSSESFSYTKQVRQTYTEVKDFVSDYFENRY